MQSHEQLMAQLLSYLKKLNELEGNISNLEKSITQLLSHLTFDETTGNMTGFKHNMSHIDVPFDGSVDTSSTSNIKSLDQYISGLYD